MDTGIDWEQVEAISDGFSPEFLEILDQLKVEAINLLQALHDQLEAENLETAARTAHQLKGALINFGFANAASLLKEIELDANARIASHLILAKLQDVRNIYHLGIEALDRASKKVDR